MNCCSLQSIKSEQKLLRILKPPSRHHLAPPRYGGTKHLTVPPHIPTPQASIWSNQDKLCAMKELPSFSALPEDKPTELSSNRKNSKRNPHESKFKKELIVSSSALNHSPSCQSSQSNISQSNSNTALGNQAPQIITPDIFLQLSVLKNLNQVNQNYTLPRLKFDATLTNQLSQDENKELIRELHRQTLKMKEITQPNMYKEIKQKTARKIEKLAQNINQYSEEHAERLIKIFNSCDHLIHKRKIAKTSRINRGKFQQNFNKVKTNQIMERCKTEMENNKQISHDMQLLQYYCCKNKNRFSIKRKKIQESLNNYYR